MNKWVVIGVILTAFVALLIWLFIESSKPLPGTKITDLGRGHIPGGEVVEYNSNPPTSGKHYDDWVRSGVFEEEKDDRNLVHSLEHGYIIMHYKCLANIDGSEASQAANLDECKTRKDQLAGIYEKKGRTKLIVIPRSNLDTNFALTAWNYLDKFDDFDEMRIIKFIEAHFNLGPERTME